MKMRTALWMMAGMVAASPLGACSGTIDGGSSGSGSSAQGSSNSGGSTGIGSASVSSTSSGSKSSASGSKGSASTSSSTVASGPDSVTTSPIKHVVVIIGENRTFDHVFATYKPKGNQKVSNLLSKGIVNEDGTPGPNYSKAIQYTAVDSQPSPYQISPGSKTPYTVLPPALAGGPKTPVVATVGDAIQDENGLPLDDYQDLTTGATGLTSGTVDTRLPNATSLPPGPFQLTPGIAYDDYSASPVHRFYEMWQQLDCNVDFATERNPSGCRSDLFPWVETTIGAGDNGLTQAQYTKGAPFTDESTGEGSTAMGFYNVLQGDAPYFKSLADAYAMSDNFHQSIQGGTGANHVALGTGDAIWFSDGNGNAEVPPTLDIENPDPQPGTNNFYTQDGYSGGTYSECADPTQPGVASVEAYLDQIHIKPNCDPGHYYLLNNYNPGYFGDGTVNTTDEFTIPPSNVKTIGDSLLEKGISWRYYGDGWESYLADPEGFSPGNEYCNICNPFQYSSNLMTNETVRTTNLKDTVDLYNDISNDFLPAFSIVKPSGLVDGHPASSKLDLFEGFTKKIVDLIQAHPDLWKDTAIFVTFDEGGGYYDSGYVQPVDFFGDGTRIPLLVVSPYATGGKISHDYGDHVSILKFVERNWGLAPITGRSRDNLPNPITKANDPYVPTNSPALGDLFDTFDFGQ
jgi:phospholipase C